MERAGADAIVAEGCESGGHVGESTTMTLVPQVVDAVDIPVIAAGGIGDGRGIAAAFMLGAKAVQMGTAFVVTEEAQVHQNYKDMVKKGNGCFHNSDRQTLRRQHLPCDEKPVCPSFSAGGICPPKQPPKW